MNRSPWFPLLKDYWWVAGVVIALASTVSLWAAMPKRLDRVEDTNERQDADLVDLKLVAAKIDGYTEALTKLQQRTLKDDMEKTEDDVVPVEVWEDPDDKDLWQFLDEDGRWCSDGRTAWRWHPTRHCHRR